MPEAERRYPEPTDGLKNPVRPLTDLLVDRAGSSAPAFTYRDYAAEREGTEVTLSWAELAEQVRTVAAELSRITSPGQRVAILAPQDLSYVTAFLGALHAGTIAVPLFAPEVSQHGERLVGALADCAPEVWLTSSESLAAVRSLAEESAVPMPKQIIAVDALEPAGADYTPPALSLDAPAYLQYTSGSTRAPAGAVITHRAVVENSNQAITAFGVDDTWTCAGWIPFFHDMGLIQLLCVPVASGARSVFITPFNFIMRPVRWLKQLSDFPKVFAAAPNFAFEYAARKVSESDRATLDLSDVRAVINGSEPVRASTIAAFQETFGPHGFPATSHRPSYGLAEATVFVTNTREEGPTVTAFDRAALGEDRGVVVERGTEGSIDLVAAGRSHGQYVRIVDPANGTLRADGDVGEIWVHGPNVASGYWEQPERSAETFGGRIAGAAGIPADGWLRTGDLGLFHDGLLYITGRIKDLIIIDGKNHYPQDIEATVQAAHPVIRRDHVAAFAVTTEDGREGAAVVAEFNRKAAPDGFDEKEVARAVRRAVSAAHDVKLRDVLVLPPGAVQRTSSGKVARAATKARHWEKAD
ncbi:fatty acyl-AMP ligase [Amycolatopsis sp. CA-230715]|uniref:fatty acyl-AMP ligase n=1 Tax=Amycolatopsis sp. CA-230715 TaxID=2745196 RepID=UPI001C038AC4|nr:fatty acyl-AMP ligase [Amycolatopsis sp. CA-230715]QWF78051.1 Long-chain-fatty-acid--AMP ligase FadD32 [Amycolatopsis sp. CA-230715]